MIPGAVESAICEYCESWRDGNENIDLSRAVLVATFRRAVLAHDHLIAALEAVLTFSNDPHVIDIARKALAVAGAR